MEQHLFYSTCYCGHLEIVRLLLNDNRIDVNKPNIYDETPLYIACQEGHIDIVKVLLNDQRVVDMNKVTQAGQTSFLIACQNGYIDIVKYLLVSRREEVDINQKDNDGKTGLDWVRERGGEEEDSLVELLKSFQRNQNETRTILRKQLDLPGNLFSFILFFIDLFFNHLFVITLLYLCISFFFLKETKLKRRILNLKRII